MSRLIWPRQTWRRVGVCLVVVLLLALSLGWYHTRPARLTPRVERMLSALTGTTVTVRKAQIGWGPSLIIEGVELAVPGDPSDAGRVFEAEHIVIGIAPGRALLGDLTPRTFDISRPILYLTEDADTGLYNLQRLHIDTDGPTTPPPKLLPRSFIDGGEVRIGQTRGGSYEVLGSIDVVGRLIEHDEEGVYHFQLMGREIGTKEQVALSGTADLNTLTIGVQVEGLTMDSVHQRFIPSAYRQWHQAIRPEGRFPLLAMQIKPNAQGQLIPTNVELQLDDLALSLPAELMGLGDDKHEIRMLNVSGVTRMVGDRIQVRFTGTIEGIAYTLIGHHGLTPDAPFDLTLATEVFELLENPKFFFALPAIAQKYHDRFSPSGQFKTTVQLKRSAEGGPIVTTGSVQLIDAHVTYSRFPYPAKVTGGTITFNETDVKLNDFQAVGPSGARFTLNGTISPPVDGAAVEIDVELIDIPIDHHLTDAMRPRHRTLVDAFFDQTKYQALIDDGLIRADQPAEDGRQPEAEEPAGVPVFNLGGTVRKGRVMIRRPYGNDSEYDVTTEMEVAGLHALYERWPYPMVAQSGKLSIGSESVHVDRIKFRGITGGTATLHGQLARPEGGEIVPDLAITDIRLPVDALLLASIPRPQDQWVRDAHLDGELTATGRVFLREAQAPGEEGIIDFHIDAKIEDARATPFAGDYALDRVAGAFQLSRFALTLDKVTAYRGESAHQLSGEIAWDEDQPRFNVNIAAQGLVIEPAVLSLIPAEHEALGKVMPLFETYKPKGVTDIAMTWAARGDSESFGLAFNPKQLAFDLGEHRLNLTDMSGQVRVFPQHLDFDRLHTAYPGGTADLHGIVGLGDTRTVLGLEAKGERIDATTRALLPTGAVTVLEGLGFEGGYHVRAAKLTRKPLAEGGFTSSFTGVIAVSKASLSLGIPITGLDGRLGLSVTQTTDDVVPRIELVVEAERLLASERLIAPLHLKLRSSPDLRSITMMDLRGSMYGGILSGKGLIVPGPDGWYAMDLTLHESELESFIDPQKAVNRKPEANAHADTLLAQPLRRTDTGLLSASLSIESPLHEAGKRQGRGALEIHDARMFDRPLSLALLQATNLSLPQSSALDRVSCRYVLMDDWVLFDSLSFESPNISITGAGTMFFPTRELDLTMYNRNPRAWDLGPVNDLFNTLKDQLIAIRVRGTLEDPDASVESLDGIRRSWDDLFGGFKARPPIASQLVPE